MNPKLVTTARILLVLYIIAVAVLCFGRFGGMENVPRSLLGIPMDKVVHFLMFLPFPLLCYPALGWDPPGPRKALGVVLLFFLIGCLIAAGTEIAQCFLPWREGDTKDFFADSLALAIASLAVFILMLRKGIRSDRV